MRLPFGRSKLLLTLSLVAPAGVLLLVWLPVWRQYSVPTELISDEVLESARSSPTDEVLREARQFYLYPIPNRQPGLEIEVAEGILRGVLRMPGGDSTSLSTRFAPQQLVDAPASLRLWIASYAVPDFLLAAYAATGRDEFFGAARDYILDWGDYERRAWLPTGLLWNDHATAARVRVLGEFWRLYRTRPDYDPEAGRKVLQQAARYGEFLSNPEYFTFATNHGVMQNLGLLHLALAFPTLPNSATLRRVAMERMDAQLAFYMDGDGVIRENSAGYQAFGLELMGMSFRTLTLLGTEIPAEWARRYQRGFDFLTQLRRPGGTLPASGDTDGAPLRGLPRFVLVDSLGYSGPLREWPGGTPESSVLHSESGYWIEWDGLEQWPEQAALRQTMMTWTSPPPPAHKHADDLAIWLWSDGTSWLTSVGYWPYSVPGRDQAVSWGGSNAPHRRGESREGIRSTRLLSSARTAVASGIEVERIGPNGYAARRLLLHVKPDLWIIVDHVHSDGPGDNTTVWTLSPAVRLRPGTEPGSFVMQGPDSRVAVRFSLVGSAGMSLEKFRGSLAPLAGWHVVDGRPQPASAIAAHQPAGESWLFTVVAREDSLTKPVAAPALPRVSGAAGAEHWNLSIPGSFGGVEVVRGGAIIAVSRPGAPGRTTDSLALVSAPPPTPGADSVRVAFERLAELFPRFEDQLTRRTKVTWLLLVLLLAQEAVLLAVRRRIPSFGPYLRLLSVIAWVGVGLWLHLAFLVSWSTVPAHVALLPPLGCLPFEDGIRLNREGRASPVPGDARSRTGCTQEVA